MPRDISGLAVCRKWSVKKVIVPLVIHIIIIKGLLIKLDSVANGQNKFCVLKLKNGRNQQVSILTELIYLKQSIRSQKI